MLGTGPAPPSLRASRWLDSIPNPVFGRWRKVSKTMVERLQLELASTLESVERVEAAAEKLAGEAGLDEDQCFRVTIAVREAAVNAVLHGNEFDPAKMIRVCLENTGNNLIFTVSDQGCGLDLEKLPDPLAPENLLSGAGRGIFLIRSFMDEVRFKHLHPGTELTLIKHLAPC